MLKAEQVIRNHCNNTKLKYVNPQLDFMYIYNIKFALLIGRKRIKLKSEGRKEYRKSGLASSHPFLCSQ